MILVKQKLKSFKNLHQNRVVKRLRMESTSRPSVFSRLGLDNNGQHQEGGRREKEVERMVERGRMEEGGEERRRRRNQREGERRSDEGWRRGEFEGRRGVRESPRKRGRDLGVSRRGSPIKKVTDRVKKTDHQDLRERVKKTIGAEDGREQVIMVTNPDVVIKSK